jgi:hypothetical protein
LWYKNALRYTVEKNSWEEYKILTDAIKRTAASNFVINNKAYIMGGMEYNIFFNQNINLENVQAGIYLVSISEGTKKVVRKIVIE